MQISCYLVTLCLLWSVEWGRSQSTSVTVSTSNMAATISSTSIPSTGTVAMSMTSSPGTVSMTISPSIGANMTPTTNTSTTPITTNMTSPPSIAATTSIVSSNATTPMSTASMTSSSSMSSSQILTSMTSSQILTSMTSSQILTSMTSSQIASTSMTSSQIATSMTSSQIVSTSMPSSSSMTSSQIATSMLSSQTVTSMTSQPVTSASPSSITPSPMTGRPDASSSSDAIIGLAAAFAVIIIFLVLLLALVIACGFWYAKRKSPVPWYLALIGRPPSQSEVVNLREKSRGMRKSVMLGSQIMDIDGTANPDQPFMNEMLRRRLMPIEVSALPEHVKKLHENMNQDFQLEYQSLEMAPQANSQSSQLEGNRHKNRYRNIVPYDHSRVRLNVLPGKENSDYINANYIDGYSDPNKFIAAQGPLLETLEDFWRMVWEVKCQNIIMLTNIKEYDIVGNERTKCDKYWPEQLDTELQLGLMCVEMQKETQLSDYVIRDLTVSTVAGKESLEVKQFHFTVWPDHGVPLFATSLIAFIRAVNRTQLTQTGGPHIVHCSAGVGRTGTYIALNAMLERIQLEDNINVYEFVRLMRSKRNFMVQTEEQYIFIHDALLELVTSGDTSVPSDIAVATINSYKDEEGDRYKGKLMSTMQKQFMLLEEYGRQPTEESCSFGRAETNRNKNRFPDRIPYDDSRVRITPNSNEDTDYINASFVDGYKRKRAYLAAQSPTERTVGDFWQMVHEKEAAVIVMLCQLEEAGQERCYKYWPDAGEAVSFGHYTVSSLHERVEDGFTLHKLNVRFSFHNKFLGSTVTNERKVMQIRLHAWPEKGGPERLTPFLSIIDTVEKLQAANKNPPITVHCSDGMGRSGTFITMYSVLEKLKPEHLLDVFQILKKARIQRPLLANSVAQYAMCYDFVFCYLESFDAYANFCVKSGDGTRIRESGSDMESPPEKVETNDT